MNEEELKHHIKSWYTNKAKNETDPFFRFMCHWICFNAWLEYRSPAHRDIKMINWLLQQTSETSDIMKSYENMTATTVGQKNLQALVTMSPIFDSRGSRPAIIIVDSNDKEHIIRGIYMIRCNLFHGGKQLSSVRDQELLACVNEIFNNWLAALVSTW